MVRSLPAAGPGDRARRGGARWPARAGQTGRRLQPGTCSHLRHPEHPGRQGLPRRRGGGGVRRGPATGRRRSVPGFPAPLGGRPAGGRRGRGVAAPGGRARAIAVRCRGAAGPDSARARRHRRGVGAAARGSRQFCRRRPDGPDAARVARVQRASRFTALDQGRPDDALDLLLAALPNADGSRDDIRRVVVAILDDLGVEHPLARDGRRRLAAALY